MKIFGRYIALPFVLLAALDCVVFFAVLQTLNLSSRCHGCYFYFGTVVSLDFYEVALLTAAFMLIATAVGLYNRDAVQDFPTFLKRFFLTWQFIFVPAVVFTAVTKAAAGLPFGWFVGCSVAGHRLVHAAAVRHARFDGVVSAHAICKKRVLVLGAGIKAETTAAFITGPGRSHHEFCPDHRAWTVSGSRRGP